MDERTQKMLEATYQLTKENNEYLKKIDRRQRYSIYWKTFLFVIAVGSALGIYYVVQPYVDQLISVYSQAEQSFIEFGTIPDQIKGIMR